MRLDDEERLVVLVVDADAAVDVDGHDPPVPSPVVVPRACSLRKPVVPLVCPHEAQVLG